MEINSGMPMHIPMTLHSKKEELKIRHTFATKVMFIALLLTSLFCITVTAAEPDLTEIFSTRAFQGAWEVIYQFNWLGQILNWIISVFSLLGLMLIMFARMTTLLYLSSRNMWDNVYEIHEGNKTAWLGLPSLFTNTFKQGSYGMGFDGVISFFYGLLPNVKRYSDYNPESMSRGNLSEDDNALNYVLKTLPNTIILMFFLSAGFSGTLAQTYGTIVSAMSTFVDNVLETNLDKYIDEIFEVGASPEFTLNADKTKKGKTQAEIAKSIYSKAVQASGLHDTTEKAQLASVCENLTTSYFTEDTVGSMLGTTISSDTDWSKVKVTVKESSNPNGTAQDKVIPMSEIVPSVSNESYIHVVFSTGAQTVNYFGQSN